MCCMKDAEQQRHKYNNTRATHYKTRRLTCFQFDRKVLSPGPTTREHEGCKPTPGRGARFCATPLEFRPVGKRGVSAAAEPESTREKGTYPECSPRRPIWQEERLFGVVAWFQIFAKCTLFRRWTRKGRSLYRSAPSSHPPFRDTWGGNRLAA
ncbi:hypothetical protein K438DRAFT_1747647 [Mycena galopus ATCC 62051]|nr:hypothetical protein K438DRAFT_1747647 [Mycena galopus ATCC 62051]